MVAFAMNLLLASVRCGVVVCCRGGGRGKGGGHLVCLMDHFVNALLGDLFQLGALGEYVSIFLHNL